MQKWTFFPLEIPENVDGVAQFYFKTGWTLFSYHNEFSFSCTLADFTSAIDVQDCEPNLKMARSVFIFFTESVDRSRSVTKKTGKMGEKRGKNGPETEHLSVGFSAGFSPKPAKRSKVGRVWCTFDASLVPLS